MKKQPLVTIFLVLILALSACSTNPELSRNRAKWDAADITHYRYELTISCFCPYTNSMPILVEVQGSKVVSITGSDGQPVPQDFLATFEDATTIEGLFGIAQDSLKNADKVEITYDTRHGYPDSIVIDWIEMAIDDEISYYVKSLTVMQ
jgi:hypothetical protein